MELLNEILTLSVPVQLRRTWLYVLLYCCRRAALEGNLAIVCLCRFRFSEQRLKTRPGNHEVPARILPRTLPSSSTVDDETKNSSCTRKVGKAGSFAHSKSFINFRPTTRHGTVQNAVLIPRSFPCVAMQQLNFHGTLPMNHCGAQPKCCCASKCSDYSGRIGARCPPHHFDCDPARHIPYCVPMGVPVYCRPECSQCGVGKVPCGTRAGGVPCGQCVRFEDATKKCRDQKWKALCDVEGTIKCATTDNCVLPQWILDGKDDCGDGSDEEPCRLVECATPPTPDPETTASETTEIVTTEKRLTLNTTTRTTPTTTTTTTTATTTTKALTQPSEISATCEFGQFRCMSGECVDGTRVLDGVTDCFDNSDEKYCEQLLVMCPAEAPCSYQPDIAAFGCGCGEGATPNEKGICQPD